MNPGVNTFCLMLEWVDDNQNNTEIFQWSIFNNNRTKCPAIFLPQIAKKIDKAPSIICSDHGHN